MSILEWISRWRHMLTPVACLGLIVVLVVPLPPPLLDILLSANISLAAVILLTTLAMKRPLDFSVFPALLLATTLFRLVLNVASTRLILSADVATPHAAPGMAGHVIEAFGSFVADSSIVVGGIIFLILVLVQFVVVTKGATRMSEVAARFTLDAMPGRQMAIDADLSAGHIDETEARTRRDGIMREADFYGAMDGASKFVRGDAIVGVIITLVNIAGGLFIGMVWKGWTLTESVTVFTTLTIGDGLVSQIPSFLIAVAAGLIVARTGGQRTLGEEIPAQLASQPTALYLVSGFLAVLALTPLPSLPILSAALVIALVAWGTSRAAAEAESLDEPGDGGESAGDTRMSAVLEVEVLAIEIGQGLVRYVEEGNQGELMRGIEDLRHHLAGGLGLVMPSVRVRDDSSLTGGRYRIHLRGAEVGRGQVHPGRVMVMSPDGEPLNLEGDADVDPAFGLPVIWIDPAQADTVREAGCSVVDPVSVVVTHLGEIATDHAGELLSREEVGRLLEQLRATAPQLVEETVPDVVKPGELQKVLQCLLGEGVPIRDMELILETLGDRPGPVRDPARMAEQVRRTLRRTITRLHARPDESGRLTLRCITLETALEQRLSVLGDGEPVARGGEADDPGELLVAAVQASIAPLQEAGAPLVVLVTPGIRRTVRGMLRERVPGVIVLARDELDDTVVVQEVHEIRWREGERAA